MFLKDEKRLCKNFLKDYVKIFIKKICIKSIKFFIVPNSSLYKGHVYGEVKLIFCYFYA